MSSRPHRLARTALAWLAAATLLGGCGGGGRAEVEPGQPLPDLTLIELDGTSVRSADLASPEATGEPLILSFWATWCQPCLREIPLLEELHDDPRFRLVTVALDEGGREVVAPFAAARELSYPILLGDQETFERFGGLTIPYTLLVAADGRIADVVRGSLERDRVEALLLSSAGG